jgi:hypothetical protein
VKQQIEVAKKAGYSDQEITDFLSKKDPRVSQALESGYKPDQVIEFLSKKSESKNFGQEGKIVGGKVGRAVEGSIKKPSLLLSEVPRAVFQGVEHLRDVVNPVPDIQKKINKKRGTELSDLYSDWSREGLSPDLKEAAQDIADIEEVLLPLNFAKKGGDKGLVPKKKIDPVQKMYNERSSLPSREISTNTAPERFESGLLKPAAVDAKNHHLALITKEKQKKVIDQLDRDAQRIIREKVEKHVPISKEIQEGVDFKEKYWKGFGELKKVAEKANPSIDISPLSSFFRESVGQYRGIPRPHKDARDVLQEVRAFQNRAPTDLKSLLRVRRSNGKKLEEIYDKRLLSGHRSEYADFLNRMNKKIDESIGKTLPEDSAWFKKYTQLNSQFSQYKKGEDTLKMLEPLLREKLNTATLTRLAESPDKQKHLRIKMGEKGASEIIQLAKDLRKARESIKKIPAKDFNKFDAIWPISWVFKPAGVATTLKKGVDYARRGYGYVLSSPKRVEALDEMVNAVSKNDLKAYQEAAKKME